MKRLKSIEERPSEATCTDCGQPMLPRGEVKRPNEYDHASGCPKGLRCAHCGKPATCIGRYEDMPEDQPACDTCCGHGCEDGHCEPIEATP